MKDGGVPDMDANAGGTASASFCAKGGSEKVPLMSPAQGDGAKCGDTPRVLVDYSGAITSCGSGIAHGAPLIAVNATHLYFIIQWTPGARQEFSQGYLMRMPLEGGTAERIALLPSGSDRGTQGLALTSTKVIFIQAPEQDVGNATISAVPLDGGQVAVLAEAAGFANAVVADDRNAYFVDTDGVKAVALAGGDTRTLAPGVVAASLALAGDVLYFTSESDVHSISLESGDSTIVAAVGGRSVIPCGAGICWLGGTGLDGTLMRLDPVGMPVTLASGFVEPHDLVFDGEVFFIGGGRGVISGVRAGGEVVYLYAEPGITSLELEGDCLYWSSAMTISSVSISAARKAVLD
jgi:hypothetical protein